MKYDLSSSSTFPPALVALPHLSNLTTIHLDAPGGHLEWIREFIRLYHYHPFRCVAAKIRHLKVKLKITQDESSDMYDLVYTEDSQRAEKKFS